MTEIEAKQRIIKGFEEAFRCMDGQRLAWFELPQRDGEIIRGTYVVYAAVGPDLDKLENWFFDVVVNPLLDKAGPGGYLYWRHPERVTAYSAADDQYVIRTRITVFSNSLDEVRIDNAIKPDQLGLPRPDGDIF